MAQIIYARQALADLERVEEFAPGALELIREAIEALARHPLLGRPVEDDFRELVISRGDTGYVALYDFLEDRDAIWIHAVRHQREVWQTHRLE